MKWIGILSIVCVSSAMGDWTWNASQGDPGFEVGGAIPPSAAYFDPGVPAYVMSYPASHVFAYKHFDGTTGDFALSVTVNYVSQAYQFSFFYGSPDFEPVHWSTGQVVAACLHNGWDNTLSAWSTNSQGSASFDPRLNVPPHPSSGYTYRVDLGRVADTMYANFFNIVQGQDPEDIGHVSWTACNPDVPLSEFYLAGYAEGGLNGLVQITEASFVPEPSALLMLGAIMLLRRR
jgi:hypothetical protein